MIKHKTEIRATVIKAVILRVELARPYEFEAWTQWSTAIISYRFHLHQVCFVRVLSVGPSSNTRDTTRNKWSKDCFALCSKRVVNVYSKFFESHRRHRKYNVFKIVSPVLVKPADVGEVILNLQISTMPDRQRHADMQFTLFFK